jgi:hypothetical protein
MLRIQSLDDYVKYMLQEDATEGDTVAGKSSAATGKVWQWWKEKLMSMKLDDFSARIVAIFARQERMKECCVCFNTIIGKAGKLPCGHDELCVDCIIKVFTQMGVKCPICRWTPEVSQASYETRMEHWDRCLHLACGRIYDKSSQDEKARAWVKEGLELFNASIDTPMWGDDADQSEAAELARQLMMVTDDEDEEDEDEEGM